MAVELKACPFCGETSPDHIYPMDIGAKRLLPMQFHCETCGANGPAGKNVAVARAAWNRRTDGR